jgi:hypothetical protein
MGGTRDVKSRHMNVMVAWGVLRYTYPEARRDPGINPVGAHKSYVGV